MARKIRVGILFGGRSAEHEVSLQSAKNIVDAIEGDKYEVVLIGIDKKGQWHLNEESRFVLPTTESGLPTLQEIGEGSGRQALERTAKSTCAGFTQFRSSK
jgi:D-alanine-D-alanine ligase